MSLYVNSDDRRITDDPRKATYAVDVREDGVRAIGMASYDVLHQFDNINSISATAYLDDGAISYPITVAVGNYSKADLATAVQASLIAALGAGQTCAVVNNRFVITTTVSVRFQQNPVYPGYKDWSIMMGMPIEGPLTTTLQGGLADMHYTNSLYFVSNAVNRRKVVADNSSSQRLNNVLGIAYLYPDRLIEDTIKDPVHATVEFSNIKYINFDPRDPVSVIDVEVLDERGNSLPDELAGQFSYVLELRMQ